MSFKIYNTNEVKNFFIKFINSSSTISKPINRHIELNIWEPFYEIDINDDDPYSINYIFTINFELTKNFDVILRSKTKDHMVRFFFNYNFQTMNGNFFINFFVENDLINEICSLDKGRCIVINYLNILDKWFPESIS